MSERTWQVIEDNGGGLTLVVLEDARAIYLHSGYEHVPGQLTEDLKGLSEGDKPEEDWEGNSEDPVAEYADFLAHDTGWEIVADEEEVYRERMGAAAEREFGELRA